MLQVHCLSLSNHMHAGHVCIVSYSSVSAHILCQVQVGSSLCCCVALNILSLCCSAYCVCQVHTLEACVSLCHWHIFHSPRCRCSPRCPKSLYNVFFIKGANSFSLKTNYIATSVPLEIGVLSTTFILLAHFTVGCAKMVELRKPIAVNVPIIGGWDHGTGRYI